LIVGCQDVNWPEFEGQLHSYVKDVLAGHFSADMSKLSNDQIREHALRVLSQAQGQRRSEMVRDVLDQAKSNSRGVTGLRRVLRSLEMGEVQTILIGENYTHAGAECVNCGHLEPNPVKTCAACGHSTRQIDDVCDAIIATAIRHDLEVFYVNGSPEFDAAGNIAALLRFRADQNMNMQAAS
jgi:peptide subunit release factor 1 (eRF1)